MGITDAIIQFSVGKASAAWATEFESRYGAPVFWDDDAHTRRRQASILDGTIVPVDIRSGDAPADGGEDTRPVIGQQITCGWPDEFLDDLADDTKNTGELFSGIIKL